jgi:hypothetical protein
MHKWHLLLLASAHGFFEGHAVAASVGGQSEPLRCRSRAAYLHDRYHLVQAGSHEGQSLSGGFAQEGKQEQEFGTTLSCEGERCRGNRGQLSRRRV